MSTPGPPKAGRGRGGRGKGRGGGGGRGKGRGGNSANTSTSTSPSASTSNNTSANMNPEAKANKPKGRNRNRGKGGRGRGSKGKQPEELTKEQQEAAQAEEELRKQKEAQEAEAKRLAAEEEAKKKEIDRQRKEQEAFEQEIRDAQETIESFLEIIQQREESRKAMEATALAEKRKEFNTQKKKLKTDVKKCTAFCKKLKSAAAWNDEKSVEQAVQTLNLSRYVDEVVKALLESKPKVADLPVILTLCRAMHTRYPDFMTNLLPALWSAISSKTPETSKVRRLYLRWITELHLAGLVPDTKALCKCIAEATGSAQNYAVQDAPLLLAFCKAGSPEILQVTPLSVANAVSWIRQQDATNPLVAEAISVADTLDETWKPTPHDTDTKQGQAYTVLQEHCNNAYHSLAESWVTTHRKWQNLERRCAQDRLLSGTLPEAREKGLADARKLQESLQKTVEAMADLMDLPLPQLPDDMPQDEAAGPGVEVWTKQEDDEVQGPFDDEETRAFYCDVPDLLTTVPPALLGRTVEEIEAQKIISAQKYGSLDVPEEEVPLEEATEAHEQEEEEEEEVDDEDEVKGMWFRPVHQAANVALAIY